MENSEQKLINVSKFYCDEERKKLMKKEYNKYKKIVKSMDEPRQKIALPLIENLAFLVISLKELREIINRDGYSEEYINGKNQRGIKRTVASDLLIANQKNYSMLFKQFKDLLPIGYQTEKMEDWDADHEV